MTLPLHAPLALLLCATPALAAPQGAGRPRPDRPGPGLVEPAGGERIAWFGTLEGGLNEAERTGKPILFVTAAPQCGSVPGVW